MINKENEILKLETVKNQINDVYVGEFFVDIPHCTVCKMQHNLEGISCPERGFVPNVTLLRYFFFFQSLSTPCSNVTSRDTTLFPTRTLLFFLNAQIL